MHDPQDKKEFGEILSAVMMLYSKDATAILLRLYWNSLIEYPLDQVRRAFDHWVKDPKQGTFMPKPADIIRTIQEVNGTPESQWLSANEAWAVALPAIDEAATVVWTPEIAKAFEVARPILEVGDKIGARMAFIPAYDRLIDQAKRESRTPSYEVSAGWDANMREVAMRQAVTAGLLPMPNDDTKALPAPGKPKMYDEHVTYYHRREAGLRFKQLAEQIRSNGDKQFHYRAEHTRQITAEHEKRKAEIIKQLQGETEHDVPSNAG